MTIKLKDHKIYIDGDGLHQLIHNDDHEQFMKEIEYIEYEYTIHEDTDIYLSQIDTRVQNYTKGVYHGKQY